VSARRDELLSKQYENEVPIRCTLFVDASNGARVGSPGATMLGSFTRIAVAVLETALASRDPVGLTLFDSQSVQVILPTTNRRYGLRLINELGRACGRPIAPVPVAPKYFMAHVGSLAHEICPRAMREIRLPFRLFPIWPSTRRQQLERYRLATVLASHFRFGSSDVGQMMGDDELFSFHLQRFLTEHQVPLPDIMSGEEGRDLFADPRSIERLSHSLRRSIAKSRDNELYVILADLLGVVDHLEPLLNAVRSAVARHHRVVIACGWPPGMEPPRADEATHLSPRGEPIAESVRAAERRLRVRAFQALKLRFAKLSVPVVCALDELTPRLILAQFELIRLGARSR
jgi:hypothetical protein